MKNKDSTVTTSTKKPIRKRIMAGFKRRMPRLKTPEHKAILKEIKAEKLAMRKATVSTLEKMWFDLDSKSVIMGAMNFVTARLTGYKWFKDKIKVKNDQSLYGRLVELLNIIITKLTKGTMK